MSGLSIGDLAQSFQLRRDNARLSERLSELTQEISTGRSARPDTRLNGDYGVQAALSSDLSRNQSLISAVSEFAFETDARQDALESVANLAREVSTTLLQISGTLGPDARLSASRTASTRFESIVDNLNTQAGGRSLFAGVDVDGPALASASTMLADIESAIATAGVTTPDEIETVVRQWFAPGGGFETTGYLGASETINGPSAGGSFNVPAPTAFDDRLRETLVGFATASLVDRGLVDPASQDAVDLLGKSAEVLLNADQQLVDLRADIGRVQAFNAAAGAELEAKTFSFEQALNALTEVDPFESAVALETAETQLRTLYALTARLSDLSLTDYLR